jgi:hypothetical protein
MRALSNLQTKLFIFWIIIGLIGEPVSLVHACELSQSSAHTTHTITRNHMTLVGKWQKRSTTECSKTYPDNVEFFERGTYVGQKQSRGSFTLWDAGEYQVLSANQVKISIATDAIKTYQYSIARDVLTFVDPDGCELQYRRVE